MEQATVRDLQAALNRKSGFEVVDHTQGETQLRIMGRQKKDAMGVNMSNWMLVIKELKVRMKKAPWKVDISKEYFVRDENEQVMYGWRLIFQADDGSAIEPHLMDIVKVVMDSKHTARGELTEITLGGAKPGVERNVGAHGKGASTIKEMPFSPRGR